MYRKQRKGWLKHLDFIVLDIILLQLSFVMAYLFRHGAVNPYEKEAYINLAVVFALVDFTVAVVFESFKNVLKRGFYKEAVATFKHVFLVVGIICFYIFTVQKGIEYSRIFLYLLIPSYLLITYAGRLIWKRVLKMKKTRILESSLIIMAKQSQVEDTVKNIVEGGYDIYQSVGIVVMDADRAGEQICGIPVVANFEDALEYIRREWVDEIFIDIDLEEGVPGALIDALDEMGVVVHVALSEAGKKDENRQVVERFANYTVLTRSMNFATSRQLFLKRGMDLVGGFVGCLITLILIVVVGPMIYFSDKGPIFFSQERVGRNGKKFKIYKFRTMYMDAEAKKAELMKENKVEGGLMFKLDFDPRIIGNKKLSDGTVKKGLGSFLRESSLDEFPQMLNVLRGDMSLVGTRPPTADEWEQYEAHHRARLAFKPGLTGMWQVSGRSNITDFEEVVKLDKKYIDEWDIGLDIKILFKTVGIVFGKKGAM